LSYEVVVRVVDEKSGLKEAVVRIRGKVMATIPFKDEDSLKRILEGIKALKSVVK
jgi:pilus assembly protein TadC